MAQWTGQFNRAFEEWQEIAIVPISQRTAQEQRKIAELDRELDRLCGEALAELRQGRTQVSAR